MGWPTKVHHQCSTLKQTGHIGQKEARFKASIKQSWMAFWCCQTYVAVWFVMLNQSRALGLRLKESYPFMWESKPAL